ncbi:hypothetical protein MRB53_038469 [Persea americana]|nr:hypothetical protein MRB53_038469 [Persea americana]
MWLRSAVLSSWNRRKVEGTHIHSAEHKKSWNELGVWNPRNGIPNRLNKQAGDDVSTWTWAWQQEKRTADLSLNKPTANSNHPVVRGVHLRKGLRRSEPSNPIPRSRLRENPNTGRVESFIMTRPWFVDEERAEETERFKRIPVAERANRFGSVSDEAVITKWDEHGNSSPPSACMPTGLSLASPSVSLVIGSDGQWVIETSSPLIKKCIDLEMLGVFCGVTSTRMGGRLFRAVDYGEALPAKWSAATFPGFLL